MIEVIDSYLQIVSALYLSVCIESTFCHHIWHPEFSARTEQFLNSNSFWKNNKLIARLKSDTDAKFNNLASCARQRGGFMFGVCILLTIYAIFEKNLSLDMPAEPISLLLSLICVFIISSVLVFYRASFIGNTLCLGACLACYSLCHHFIRTDIWNTDYNLWITVAAIVVITIPLIYQFAWYRLTNSFYMSFWGKILNKERAHFEKAKYIEENGGNPDPLPIEYRNYFAKCHVNRQSTQDRQMNGLNECFFTRVSDQCTPQGLFKLICFRLGFSKSPGADKTDTGSNSNVNTAAKEQKLRDSVTPIQAVGTTNLSQTEFERCYQLYNAMKKKPTLEQFCKDNKLKYDTFYAYYKRRQTGTAKDQPSPKHNKVAGSTPSRQPKRSKKANKKTA